MVNYYTAKGREVFSGGSGYTLSQSSYRTAGSCHILSDASSWFRPVNLRATGIFVDELFTFYNPHFSFYLYINSLQSAGNYYLPAMRSNTTVCGQFWVDSNGIIYAQCQTSGATLARQLYPGRWHHIEGRVVVADAGFSNNVTLKVDGEWIGNGLDGDCKPAGISTINQIIFMTDASVSGGSYVIDDIVIGDTAYPGETRVIRIYPDEEYGTYTDYQGGSAPSDYTCVDDDSSLTEYIAPSNVLTSESRAFIVPLDDVVGTPIMGLMLSYNDTSLASQLLGLRNNSSWTYTSGYASVTQRWLGLRLQGFTDSDTAIYWNTAKTAGNKVYSAFLYVASAGGNTTYTLGAVVETVVYSVIAPQVTITLSADIVQSIAPAFQASAGALIFNASIVQITAAAEQTALGVLTIAGAIVQELSAMEQEVTGLVLINNIGTIAQNLSAVEQSLLGVAITDLTGTIIQELCNGASGEEILIMINE